jgi:hypothetical protein
MQQRPGWALGLAGLLLAGGLSSPPTATAASTFTSGLQGATTDLVDLTTVSVQQAQFAQTFNVAAQQGQGQQQPRGQLAQGMKQLGQLAFQQPAGNGQQPRAGHFGKGLQQLGQGAGGPSNSTPPNGSIDPNQLLQLEVAELAVLINELLQLLENQQQGQQQNNGNGTGNGNTTPAAQLAAQHAAKKHQQQVAGQLAHGLKHSGQHVGNAVNAKNGNAKLAGPAQGIVGAAPAATISSANHKTHGQSAILSHVENLASSRVHSNSGTPATHGAKQTGFGANSALHSAFAASGMMPMGVNSSHHAMLLHASHAAQAAHAAQMAHAAHAAHAAHVAMSLQMLGHPFSSHVGHTARHR